MIRHAISPFRYSALCAALIFLSCGCSHINLYHNHLTQEPFLNEKERPLAIIAYNESATEDSSTLHLYKAHKGYAIKAYLDGDANQSTNAVISKSKERKMFVGMEWKWSF